MPEFTPEQERYIRDLATRIALEILVKCCKHAADLAGCEPGEENHEYHALKLLEASAFGEQLGT